MHRPRVVILSQDLIWGDRLARSVEAAGGEPSRTATEADLDRALDGAHHAIVDLTARAYDPIGAIGRARSSGARVLAVGPHDDVALRKRALVAGADKVLAYRKLFEDGPDTIRGWLAAAPRGAATGPNANPDRQDDHRLMGIEGRIGKLATMAAEDGLDAALIAVGPDLEYLTGYRAMPLERLTMLAIVANHDPVLYVPRLEHAAARAGLRVPVEIRTWDETDDPHLMVARLVRELSSASRIAVSDRLIALHLLRLQAQLAGAAWSSVTPILRRQRMIKDADEIGALRRAGAAADRVVDQIASGRLVGRTEAEVADEVRERLRAEGHELAQFAIVASGPNSASPHHEASDRVIQAGEPIVLDIGGTLDRYNSDTTRTLWVTGGDEANGPAEEFRHLFGVLLAAQEAATRAVRPGIAAEAVDRTARDIIDGEGYGEAFFHRTGHGIGLEGHEEPYLVSGNVEPLAAGMAFSIEPGIYLPGRYGARIEDIVVCGPDGPIVLNNGPRTLRVVTG